MSHTFVYTFLVIGLWQRTVRYASSMIYCVMISRRGTILPARIARYADIIIIAPDTDTLRCDIAYSTRVYPALRFAPVIPAVVVAFGRPENKQSRQTVWRRRTPPRRHSGCRRGCHCRRGGWEAADRPTNSELNGLGPASRV